MGRTQNERRFALYGLEAITANNGWAMAATGACIVITGLTVLSIIISQLHRIIEALSEREKVEKTPQNSQNDTAAHAASPIPEKVDLLEDLEETARIHKPFTELLGETFKLVQLYEVFEASKLPHPYITVRQLRNAGYLVPAGKDTFTWKNI
jgi:uncharacterized membrane protein YcjF (UPF0283 family)